MSLPEPAHIDFHLVRLGLPAKGDTIHRSTCRYAQRGNALRWAWADKNPGEDWMLTAPWLHQCQVCMPPSPFDPEAPARAYDAKDAESVAS